MRRLLLACFSCFLMMGCAVNRVGIVYMETGEKLVGSTDSQTEGGLFSFLERVSHHDKIPLFFSGYKHVARQTIN